MIERYWNLNLRTFLHVGAAALMATSASTAEARSVKELAQGALIGAGIAVLVDGPGRGVLTGATAGMLVAAISRRGRSD
jgi:hypothetical protein